MATCQKRFVLLQIQLSQQQRREGLLFQHPNVNQSILLVPRSFHFVVVYLYRRREKPDFDTSEGRVCLSLEEFDFDLLALQNCYLKNKTGHELNTLKSCLPHLRYTYKDGIIQYIPRGMKRVRSNEEFGQFFELTFVVTSEHMSLSVVWTQNVCSSVLTVTFESLNCKELMFQSLR